MESEAFVEESAHRLNPDFYSIGNIYLAYRKAKTEAFYESTHFHALAFTKFEQDLHRNLLSLQRRLKESSPSWPRDPAFIGDHAYLPKSVDTTAWDSTTNGHYRALDPRSDWRQRFMESRTRANASLRLVIRPTVEFQVVSALWILCVGHLFDAALDRATSFGNRLRRSRSAGKDDRLAVSSVNLTTPALFEPYFSAYRNWRERGLAAMESSVEKGQSIWAITMDVEKFYHRVSPRFILRKSFLAKIGLTLNRQELRFTSLLLEAIETWYGETPDAIGRPEGAIPVGLSASKIIANVLLVEFDRAVPKKLNPIYYGRYVDDVFLVLNAAEGDHGAARVTARIAAELDPLVKVRHREGEPDSLRLVLPYAKDSKLIFAGPKQKIFALSSAHGADLVHHIRDQIRQHSSEYRLLPSVPPTGVAMAARALLASSNAALQADALRKADVISVRRLGLSLLLSDIETYAADLKAESWRPIRQEFYGLVRRHVITPSGFFEYFNYLPRVFGLMVSCGDFQDATELIGELREVEQLLRASTTLGEQEQKPAFDLCMQQYAVGLLEAGLKSATMDRDAIPKPGLLRVLKGLRALHSTVPVPRTTSRLHSLTKQILLADWGRRPYKDYWIQEQAADEQGPPVPRRLEIRRQLRLGGIRRFRTKATQLKVPHWPALAFPTRPLRPDELGLVAPDVLTDARLFKSAIKLMRGAEVVSSSVLGFHGGDEGRVVRFRAAGRPRESIRLAVTSIGVTQVQWESAAKLKQDRSLARYEGFNAVFNSILREAKRPDYIVLPELCIPLRWALRAARKLATNGVSLLAGVEYHRDPITKKLRNDCLVSLTTFWPGYASSVVLLQPKFAPAHGEREGLEKLLGKRNRFFTPTGPQSKPTIYEHRGFFFSPLICSDLTNIDHRSAIRGEVDALFALNWNPDTKTFASLVEASAADLHAFVIQANNRAYGDSRIRAPAAKDYERDVVQVRGGVVDYYVLGEINVSQLRREQHRPPGVIKPGTKGVNRTKFKPLPIGYISGAARKAVK